MKVYPALKGNIGEVTPLYYVVLMKVRDLVAEVRFAEDVLKPKSLSDHLQRGLDKARTKKIVEFFERKDRFISSIVVATVGGKPEFHEVEVKNNPFLSFGGINQYFGALTFNGGEQYYALDGQHRLFALREAAQKDDGVAEDIVSVILIPGDGNEGLGENTKKRYRNLFTWMNRYAKPTKPGTNIIMDEEDLYAIVTRRLIEEHPQFSGKNRVDTENKAINPKKECFTTIQTLYEFTKLCLAHLDKEILETAERTRPSAQIIENCLTLSKNIWDCLRQLFDEMDEEPKAMRNSGENGPNILYFRTMGQLLLAELISHLIVTDNPSTDQNTPLEKLKETLAPLALIDWELKNRPWRHLLVTVNKDTEGNNEYKMRRESLSKLPVDIGKFMLTQSYFEPEKEDGRLKTLEERWKREMSKFFPNDDGGKALQKEWSKAKEAILNTRKKINDLIRN